MKLSTLVCKQNMSSYIDFVCMLLRNSVSDTCYEVLYSFYVKVCLVTLTLNIVVMKFNKLDLYCYII